METTLNTHWSVTRVGCLTPAGVQQLSPLDEAQVAGAGPQCLGLPEAEVRVEVVRLQALLAIDGVVAAGAMGAVHPDLHKQQQHVWVRAFM